MDHLGSSPWERLNEARNVMTGGLKALAGYFAKYGIELDVEGQVQRALDHLDWFGVFDPDNGALYSRGSR